MDHFSSLGEPAGSKWENNLAGTPEKNNLQSAVLGMLSLSQSHQFPLPYSYNNDITNRSSFDVDNSSTSTEGRNGSAALILTPPGSPQEERCLVINCSPEKSPAKPPLDCQNYVARSHSLNDSEIMKMFVNSTCVQNGFTPASSSQNYSVAPFFNPTDCLDASAVSLAFGVAGGGGAASQQPLIGRRNSRSEKRPIPVEQKDDKYFERRRRNNVAAKKSRDTRKQREDEIALRAAYLEKENAILRAQLGTLREEAQSLRHLLLQKRQRQMQMHLQQTSTMALG